MSFFSGISSLPRFAQNGARVALFGDSMTDWYNINAGNPIVSSAVYSADTGVLQLTYSAAPSYWGGLYMRLWNYNYTGLRQQIYAPLSRVSATVWNFQAGQYLPNVPNGDIVSGLFYYPNQARALNSFVARLQMLLNQRLQIVRNGAQSGDTTAGVLARLQRDVISWRPDVVIGQCPGINDLASSNGSKSLSEITQNLEAIFDRLLAANINILVGTISPVGAAEPRGTQANMQTVLLINDWVYRYARNRQTMRVFDNYSQFADITSTLGLGLASRLRSDAIHPAGKTAGFVAGIWAPTLADVVQYTDTTLPKTLIDSHPTSRLTVSSATALNGVVTVNSTANGYKVTDQFRARGATPAAANGIFTVASAATNLFTYAAPGVADGAVTGLQISQSKNILGNPLFQTTTGGTVNTAGGNFLSGAAPSLFACSNGIGAGCTAVASTVAAANVSGSLLVPAVGNAFQLEVTAATANNRPQFANAGSTTLSQDMLAGQSYLLEFVLHAKGNRWDVTQIKNLIANFTVTLSSGDTLSVQAFSASEASETDVFVSDFSFHVRMPVVTIPAGATVTGADFIIGFTMQSTFALGVGEYLRLQISEAACWTVTGNESLYL